MHGSRPTSALPARLPPFFLGMTPMLLRHKRKSRDGQAGGADAKRLRESDAALPPESPCPRATPQLAHGSFASVVPVSAPAAAPAVAPAIPSDCVPPCAVPIVDAAGRTGGVSFDGAAVTASPAAEINELVRKNGLQDTALRTLAASVKSHHKTAERLAESERALEELRRENRRLAGERDAIKRTLIATDMAARGLKSQLDALGDGTALPFGALETRCKALLGDNHALRLQNEQLHADLDRLVTCVNPDDDPDAFASLWTADA